eukprot:5982375-Ditylum_brightwellii.AAC.1
MDTNKANQETHCDLLATEGSLIAGMENTYLRGLPDAMVPTVAMHRAQLREVGLELMPARLHATLPLDTVMPGTGN